MSFWYWILVILCTTNWYNSRQITPNYVNNCPIKFSRVQSDKQPVTYKLSACMVVLLLLLVMVEVERAQSIEQKVQMLNCFRDISLFSLVIYSRISETVLPADTYRIYDFRMKISLLDLLEMSWMSWHKFYIHTWRFLLYIHPIVFS